MGISKFETSFSDYPKHIGLLVFTDSCNLNCPHCYNKEYIDNNKNSVQLHEIEKELKSGLYNALIVSGGECSLDKDLLTSLLELGRKYKMHNKIYTNGTNPDVILRCIYDNLVDFVSLDVKFRLDDVDYDRIAKIIGSVDEPEVTFEKYKKAILCLIMDMQNVYEYHPMTSDVEFDYELRLMTIPDVVSEKDVFDYIEESEHLIGSSSKVKYNKFKKI